MKKYLLIVSSVLTFVYASSFMISSHTGDEVPYPEGYRKWTHIKTGLIGPQDPSFKFVGGFHHIYANEKAMEGYLTGNFPDGAILVFDVLEANEKNSNQTEGKRKHIDVMIRDSAKYSDTGGWGYEEFKEGLASARVLTPVIKTQCFTCHSKQSDHVFSDFRK